MRTIRGDRTSVRWARMSGNAWRNQWSCCLTVRPCSRRKQRICLYPDQACRHIREPRHNFAAGHLLTLHDLSSGVEANQVQCVLAGIDTNGDDCGVKLAWHDLFLLLIAPTSMLAGLAGARPVHPISGHRRKGLMDVD